MCLCELAMCYLLGDAGCFNLMYRPKMFPNAVSFFLGNAGCFILMYLPELFPNALCFFLGDAGCFILMYPPKTFPNVMRFLLGDANCFLLLYSPEMFPNAMCFLLGDAGCFILMYPPEMFPNSIFFLQRTASIFFFTIAIVIFPERFTCRCLFPLAICLGFKDAGCFNLIYPPEKFPHSQPFLVRFLVCFYKIAVVCYARNNHCFSSGILIRVSFKFWRPKILKKVLIHWTDKDLVTVRYSAKGYQLL